MVSQTRKVLFLGLLALYLTSCGGAQNGESSSLSTMSHIHLAQTSSPQISLRILLVDGMAGMPTFDKTFTGGKVQRLYDPIGKFPYVPQRRAPFSCSPDPALSYKLIFTLTDGHTASGYYGTNLLCGGISLEGGKMRTPDTAFRQLFFSLIENS